MECRTIEACNLDACIQLSPYALVYVVSAMLRLFVVTLHWSSYAGSRLVLRVAVYVTGLIVLERRQTQSRIARLIGHVSHDALNRLASDLMPLYDQMVIGLLLSLEALSPGYLILDDVLIPKPFAKYLCGAYPSYDHAQKRHVTGQRLVVLIWSNGVFCIPVAFVCWHHRQFVTHYRTKNELARILVYWAVRHHLPCTYLTFDNWYASKQNLRFFTGLGLTFVTKLRRNARVTFPSASGTVPVSWYPRIKGHYYGALAAYVMQFTVKYPGYGTGRLAVVTHDRHAESGRTKYLFTNAMTLTNREVVLRYRNRWTSECVFRACKQSFGLGACQASRMPQVLLHIRMVFLAYTLTQFLVTEPDGAMDQTQTHLRSLACLRVPARLPVIVVQHLTGRLEPVPLESLLVPLRTRIPVLQEVPVPTLQGIMECPSACT
jgi:hypothetical protein